MDSDRWLTASDGNCQPPATPCLHHHLRVEGRHALQTDSLPPVTVLLVVLSFIATVPALLPTEALAADRDVAKQVGILEQHAKEPFEQREREKAIRALGGIGKQDAKGWGAFYEPLTAALETEADTIVLLSDGSPSRGILDRMEFPKANRFRQVAVCTVLIGTKGADQDFMRDLSAETGGRFSQVR